MMPSRPARSSVRCECLTPRYRSLANTTTLVSRLGSLEFQGKRPRFLWAKAAAPSFRYAAKSHQVWRSLIPINCATSFKGYLRSRIKFMMVSLVCSLVLNVNPFMTDIFPEHLTIDQIVDHQQKHNTRTQQRNHISLSDKTSKQRLYAKRTTWLKTLNVVATVTNNQMLFGRVINFDKFYLHLHLPLDTLPEFRL
jgi:hypothetical protein